MNFWFLSIPVAGGFCLSSRGRGHFRSYKKLLFFFFLRGKLNFLFEMQQNILSTGVACSVVQLE